MSASKSTMITRFSIFWWPFEPAINMSGPKGQQQISCCTEIIFWTKGPVKYSMLAPQRASRIFRTMKISTHIHTHTHTHIHTCTHTQPQHTHTQTYIHTHPYILSRAIKNMHLLQIFIHYLFVLFEIQMSILW